LFYITILKSKLLKSLAISTPNHDQ